MASIIGGRCYCWVVRRILLRHQHPQRHVDQRREQQDAGDHQEAHHEAVDSVAPRQAGRDAGQHSMFARSRQALGGKPGSRAREGGTRGGGGGCGGGAHRSILSFGNALRIAAPRPPNHAANRRLEVRRTPLTRGRECGAAALRRATPCRSALALDSPHSVYRATPGCACAGPPRARGRRPGCPRRARRWWMRCTARRPEHRTNSESPSSPGRPRRSCLPPPG